MNKPRIFLSSTFYDLKYLREYLEQFIGEKLGYEPVLHDKGDVIYNNTGSLEDDCYEQISACDILLNVVGANFGSESKDNSYSISQNELFRAINEGIVVYVFVESAVESELDSYKLNNDTPGYKTRSDIRVLRFLDELKTKYPNTVRFNFTRGRDITKNLKKQLSGLFKQLLDEKRSRTRISQNSEKSISKAGGKKYDIIPYWNHAKEIKDSLKNRNLKYNGLWKTEFKREGSRGFSCGIDIQFYDLYEVQSISTKIKKFESYGVIKLTLLIDSKASSSFTLFDGSKETDSIVVRNIVFESGTRANAMRLEFAGDTAGTAWYEVEKFEFK